LIAPLNHTKIKKAFHPKKIGTKSVHDTFRGTTQIAQKLRHSKGLTLTPRPVLRRKLRGGLCAFWHTLTGMRLAVLSLRNFPHQRHIIK
jgi:hypothetical protein